MTRLSTPFRILVLTVLLMTASASHALCLVTGTSGFTRICWNPLGSVSETVGFEFVLWNANRSEYIAVGEGGAILTSSDGNNWTSRNSSTVQKLYSAIWDGSRYIVVGEGGLVLTSTDAATWTPRVTNTRLALFDIAWNNDSGSPVYVAVGQNGVMLTSVDAVNWTATNISITTDNSTSITNNALGILRVGQPLLRAITWSNGRFVAVGSSSTIISSSNGVSWSVHSHVSCTSPPCLGVTLRDVTVNSSGRFVAVGESGTTYVSDDGDSWAGPNKIFSHPDASLYSIAWSGSQFIAVGDDGANPSSALVLSGLPDGLNWSADNSLPVGIPAQTIKSVTFGQTEFVAVGDKTILSGVPASAWDLHATDPGMTGTLNDVLRTEISGAKYFAVGENGTLLNSVNGFDWAAVDLNITTTLNGIAWNGNNNSPLIAAVGENGTVFVSSNGTDWSPPATQLNPASTLFDIAFGNGQFVAVGAGGAIFTSTNGAVWALTASGITTDDLHGVAWNGVRFVAVGENGVILISLNGNAWVKVDSGTTQTLNAVASNNQRFVAVGSAGVSPNTSAVIRISSNGTIWDSETAVVPESPGLNDVAWNGTQFMAVGENISLVDGGGSFLRSSDGQIWTSLGFPDTNSGLNAIAWDGARFLTVGDGGAIYNSGGIDFVISVDITDPDDLPTFSLAEKLKQFRFDIVNIGNLDVPAIQFAYVLPNGFSFPTTDPFVVAQAGAVCIVPGEAVCNLERQIAGTGLALRISVNVIADGQGSVTSTASLGPAPSDTNPGNNQVSFTTVVGPSQSAGLPDPDVTFSGGALEGWTLLALLILLTHYGRRRYMRVPGC